MKFIRNLFDKYEHLFVEPSEGEDAQENTGKLKKFFPLYDVVEHFFFTTVKNTQGNTSIRDAVDVQRIMVVVWLCTFPAMFWGMYNTGYQSLTAMATSGAQINDWHAMLIEMLNISNPDSLLDCLLFGAIYFFPIYIVTFAVGILWEILFAVVRKEEISEGFFVTSILFALSCPPDAPLWQVAIGISFGVVVAKEIFGGTGMNFVNPALAGRAFLYFAYPAQWSGDTAWLAVDGVSQATPLGIAASVGLEGILQQWTFLDALFGNIPGSIGETSVIAIAIGGLIMLFTGVASWRIVLGVILGVVVTSTLFNFIGSETNPMFAVPFYWHLVIGGLAFMTFFMATEPVTASTTPTGRWIYGFLIGFSCVLIRVVNPAFPEGAMLSVLLANLFAPLIDYYVIKYQIKSIPSDPIGLK